MEKYVHDDQVLEEFNQIVKALFGEEVFTIKDIYKQIK